MQKVRKHKEVPSLTSKQKWKLKCMTFLPQMMLIKAMVGLRLPRNKAESEESRRPSCKSRPCWRRRRRQRWDGVIRGAAGALSRGPRDKVQAAAQSSSQARTGQQPPFGNLEVTFPKGRASGAGGAWEVRRSQRIPVKAVPWLQRTFRTPHTVP